MAAPAGRRQWAVNRRVRVALLVNGLRWRGRSSLAMFVVAVFACGAAAFGPIYLQSSDQLALTRTLAGAAPGNAGLTLQNASFPLAGHHSRSWLRNYAEHPPEPGTGTRWWGKPIMTLTAGLETVPLIPSLPGSQVSGTVRPTAPAGAGSAPAAAPAPAGAGSAGTPARLLRVPYLPTHPYSGLLVARTGECGHLHLVAGICPQGRDQGVAISTRTDQTLGIPLGGGLEVLFGPNHPARLHVVGIYDPGNAAAPYWWGQNFFGFNAISSSGLLDVDAAFTTTTGLLDVAPHKRVNVIAQVPYRQGTLTTGTVGAIRADLAAFHTHSLTGERVQVSTLMPALLSHAGSVEHTEATVVDVTDLELVLLGLLVLYFVASRTAAEREPDVRLGELRGFRSRSTLAVALAEPVAIVAAAAPVGLLGGWLVAAATAPAIFGSGVGVSVNLLALGAAVAAGLVGVAAAGLGARRSLAGGLSAAADAPSGEISLSKWYVLGDAAVVALAAAAFFALAVGGDSGNAVAGSNPLAAFAPGLLAVALGILAARLLPRLLSATHRRSAYSARLPLSLAARTVARRREYRTQLVLTALAVSLATFAVSGWAVAARNRDQRTELRVGANKVLTVSVKQGTTFLRDVRGATPGGKGAMAVVLEHAADGTTLAVDARQLGSVSFWPRDLGLRPAAAARLLHPRGLEPEVPVAGSTVAAELEETGTVHPAPQLTMEVYDIDTQFTSTIQLGALQPGLHRYSGKVGVDCPGGCRLLGLALTWTSPSSAAGAKSPTVTLRLHSLSERSGAGPWRTVPARLGTAGGWFSPTGGTHLAPAGPALAVRVSFVSGDTVVLAPKTVPPAVPVVVTTTSSSQASGEGGPLLVGLDGSTLAGHSVGEVPALPGVVGDAVLATLATMQHELTGNMLTDTTEVWLSRSAPASIVRSLEDHGLHVLGVATTAAAVAGLDRNGLTLAYLLYLVAAVAAALLVMGATAFTLSSAARRRQNEFSALRAIGVQSRALRRTVQLEQAIVLATGLVTGVVAGAVAAAVTLRSVPEFLTHAPGPPLQLQLPAADVAVAVGAVVVALVLTVLACSSIVVGGASAERLAGGQS